jgi:hypothetical protein
MLLGAAEARVEALSGPSLAQAEEAVRLARIGYGAGKFSLLELLDAQPRSPPPNRADRGPARPRPCARRTDPRPTRVKELKMKPKITTNETDRWSGHCRARAWRWRRNAWPHGVRPRPLRLPLLKVNMPKRPKKKVMSRAKSHGRASCKGCRYRYRSIAIGRTGCRDHWRRALSPRHPKAKRC